MKLAEGLSQRSDAQKRLAQLQSRAVACARYQEGEAPAESAADLLAEARAVGDEIENLIRRINRTNAATELDVLVDRADEGGKGLSPARRTRTGPAPAVVRRSSPCPGMAEFIGRQAAG